MNSIFLPESLVQQLRAYELKLKRMETLVAVAGGFVGLFVTYVLLFVFDRFVNTPVWARVVLTVAGAAFAAWFAQGWARSWLWNRRGPAALAKLLQKHFRVLGDRLQGVIELTQIEQLPADISPALLRAAIRQVADDSGRYRFEEAVPVRPARRWAFAGIVAAALTAAPFLFAPGAAANALKRWAMPWSGVERYTFTTVESLPDDLYIPHGEAFELSVGLRPDAKWKPSSATARIERQDSIEAQVQDSKALFKFVGQTRDGRLSLRFGDYLKDIVVHPLHRPELKGLAAIVKQPDYLGYPESRVALQGTLAEFLKGSSVAFEGSISRNVGSGTLTAGDRKISAIAAGTTFRTPVMAAADLGAEISLRWTDIHGLTPVQPYMLKIGATDDAPPRVEIQGIETQEVAILPNEEVRLTLAAGDDYGLKEMWIGWSARRLNEKSAETNPSGKDGKDWVGKLWDELQSQAASKGEAPKALPQIPHIPGGQMIRELSRPLVWSPAANGVGADTVVELAGFALDYMPKREPSTSPKLTIFVLSPEKHAERIREKMDQVLKQLDERIRDEERAIEENKAIAENKKDINSEKAAEELKRVEAGEKANEEALKKLAEQIGEVMKDALRNKEIQSDTINEMSKIAEALEKQATPEMQKAQQQMAQAAQEQEQEQREKKLAEAMKDQQAALDAMRQAASKMQTANENLFARNFYNRLRLAASVEQQISDSLKKLAKATVGLKPEEIGDGEKKAFQGVAGKQDGNVKDVDGIQNDMTSFVRRVPNPKYQGVVGEMEEKRVVPELTDLAGAVRGNLGLKSAGRAKTWGDQLTKWAEMLQDKQKSGEGEGKPQEMDPDLMELMIALVRVAVAEDGIRDQTGDLERTREKNPNYAPDTKKLGTTQNLVSGTVKEIAENPKFSKFMGDVGPLLEQVTGLMKEVSDELVKPNTDQETVATEAAIIELLVPPGKKSDEDKDGKGKGKSPQMAQMQQMMQKMMQQMGEGKTAGKNNSKKDSSMEGIKAQGATARNKLTDRTVDKGSGAANAGDWPEEFRDSLQAYFQSLEDKKR